MFNRRERVSDIGGEILKNLVLLGVRRISMNKAVDDSFKRICPVDAGRMNEDMEVRMVDEPDGKERYDLAVFVDQVRDVESCVGIYVCSSCMMFQSVEKKHECSGYVLGDMVFVNDCLLGAIVVQEWVKRLQNRPHAEEFQLSL